MCNQISDWVLDDGSHEPIIIYDKEGEYKICKLCKSKLAK